MVRPAPATVRTVALLDFFAAHAGQPFTLSELARSLDVNMASLLAILTALTDAGYVVRHPRHKTYALGPALVGVGQAALAQHTALDAARAGLHSLAAELGTECVASVAVGDEMVMVATEGVAPAGARDIRVGHRVPMIPPLGSVFHAWAAPDAVERWLARDPDGRARHLHLLDVVRERGYSLGVGTEEGGRLLDALDAAAGPARIATLAAEMAADYSVVDLDPDASYTVSAIAAPVFDADQRVALAFTVNGFGRALPAADVVARADRVVAMARAITKRIHGQPPVLGTPTHQYGG